MNNNWIQLAILLSIFLLMAFPFVGWAPLITLLFVGLCGWAFHLGGVIMSARQSTDAD